MYPPCRFSRKDIWGETVGEGTPEEGSEITKAGVIDGRFSIDLLRGSGFGPPLHLEAYVPLMYRSGTICFSYRDFFFFIPSLDRISPTTRFMTRTLSHSISKFQLRAKEMPSRAAPSKFPRLDRRL